MSDTLEALCERLRDCAKQLDRRGIPHDARPDSWVESTACIDAADAITDTQMALKVLADHNDKLWKERDALRSANEQLARDAGRWRYIREHSCKHDGAGNDVESWSTHNTPEDFEAVIDAALSAAKGGEK